ncbi:hypothetical protein VTJ04DRAFT_2357 [Mycothermus thermophilus]|uniref:uncharacterized protein n=1 Tax=Humicola insolens TaxID=85995 RepID=UPI003743B140
MDVFRVRLNCIDHYQATPSKYDPPLRKDAHLIDPSRQPKVPVIRVFGSTETGQKVCAHIHGAFPYLFVEYRGPLDKPTYSEYIYRMHLSIDHALTVSYRRDPSRGPQRYVARITLVKGIPFYGFHVGYRFYLKIYMLNPLTISRLADLLQQGVIMGRKFQPYEAHLQYQLQFMADYNLYGCDYLEAEKVRFRAPVPEPAGPDEAPRIWDSNTIDPSTITDHEDGLQRMSHCSIEVDICAQNILNRKAIKERRLHHDFIERIHPIPRGLKLVHSMAGLWKDEAKRRRKRQGLAGSGRSPFPRDALVSMSADPRNSQPPGWIHEEEYREQIRQLIEEERPPDGVTLTFENYIQPIEHEENIPTVLQSVEDMFPDNLLPALGLEQQLVAEHQDVSSSIQVDEGGILELEVPEDEQQLAPDEGDGEGTIEGPEEPSEDKPHQQGGVAQTKLPIIASKGPDSAQSSSDSSLRGLTAELKETIGDVFSGVGISGLRLKKRPSMPLPKDLLSEATTPDLLSRDIESDDTETARPVKRSAPLAESQVPPKRLRWQADDPPSSQDPANANPSEPGAEPRPRKRGIAEVSGSSSSKSKPPPSSQSKKQAIRSSSQSSQGNQTLNFPVVKDPQDPDTILRLSQKTSSQRSDDGSGSAAKSWKVAFDPLLSVQEFGSSPETPTYHTSVRAPASTGAPSQPRLKWCGPTTMFVLADAPPSVEEVCSTMQTFGLPDIIYQDAFYSKDEDVPPRPREYAGKEFRLDGNSVPYLPPFDPTGQSPATFGAKAEQGPDLAAMEAAYERQRRDCTLRSWEIAEPPPSFDEVSQWWEEKQKAKTQKAGSTRPPPPTQKQPELSQIVGPTPRNTHGFKYSQKQKSSSVQHEAQYMSMMSLEVHVNTRGKLVPNPEEDEVQCIFWCLRSDEQCLSNTQSYDATISGIVVLSEDGRLAEQIRKQTGVEVAEETTELDVLIRMVEIVRTHDPDIVTGYEVHGTSWGYLVERAALKYDYDLCAEFSRTKSDSAERMGRDADRWGFKTTSTLHITGRHVINIWRAMRGELNLLQYTMENVAWHLLHRRIPHYSWRTLTAWYRSGRPRDLARVLRYYLKRTRIDLEILEANELIPRTSEQARLLGVDFFSVFSRGSQFKVESIMFRIAKPENFMLVSPSRKQVGAQNALECLPLVMEPQSAFYTSPVVVLDFQSLYPSVMIAYNYCYSTCLGRIVNWRGTNKLGFTEYRRREGLLGLLRDHINIAPNGMMYVKPEIRRSLLAKMLSEILETRVMVKSGMKEDKDDRTLQKLLNNRQLALKLLANVTYGYTSASFSGRMPCAEIADSIVQTSRETLERAIAYIHSVERWRAEVVYGDTDSLFVHLPGRTREQAFEIGADMAREITAMNPRPVKLKFEKVYHPCVLLAKKRYVGYKYESPDQAVPEFDAKGIETVRRDGTPAEQLIEEKALRILFETADLSQVKDYFQAQCSKIMRGAVSVGQFVFQREVKLGSYSGKGPGPAGALISARRMAEDARAEPQYGERVPYVVIAGAPGARLIDRCVAPEELLANPHATLDAEYYITKTLIPPLERIFNLVGANVRAWYDEMPKVQPARRLEGGNGKDGAAGRKKKTLESFLNSTICLACGVKMAPRQARQRRRFFAADDTTITTVVGGEQQQRDPLPGLCGRCSDDTLGTMSVLQARLAHEQRRYADVVRVCRSCAGFAPGEEGGMMKRGEVEEEAGSTAAAPGEEDAVPCDSRDCPVFYTRVKQRAKVLAEMGVVEPLLEKLAGGVGREELEW